jgi:hypothetical protein
MNDTEFQDLIKKARTLSDAGKPSVVASNLALFTISVVLGAGLTVGYALVTGIARALYNVWLASRM